MAREEEGKVEIQGQIECEEAIAQCANLYLAARKLLLTSLSAVALSADEEREFLDILDKRGECANSDVRKLVGEAHARRRAMATELNHRQRGASAAVEDSVGNILQNFSVPTRSDIEELSRKISKLNRKVRALQQKPGPKQSHR